MGRRAGRRVRRLVAVPWRRVSDGAPPRYIVSDADAPREPTKRDGLTDDRDLDGVRRAASRLVLEVERLDVELVVERDSTLYI